MHAPHAFASAGSNAVILSKLWPCDVDRTAHSWTNVISTTYIGYFTFYRELMVEPVVLADGRSYEKGISDHTAQAAFAKS